jgi:8-oxo-dGTP pyrophosphatase MutT (NUDIX family)
MSSPIATAESIATTRDFTVAVFVVHRERVLLHLHEKLNRWLPPGGHIEPHELPDEAAKREVFEETGVAVALVGDSGISVTEPGQPVQLCRPIGIQLENIADGHQHIDLIYLAVGIPAEPRKDVGWFAAGEWADLDLTDEVEAWCRLAVERVAGDDSFR